MGQNRPFAIALLAFAAWPALAQDIRQKQIRLSAGEPVRLRDTIHGNETIDYRLDAAKGSNLTIAIKTSSPSADFNFYGLIGADGMPDQSIFTGSAMGNNFTGRISESGEYVIRVYLRRNAARPNEEAHFRLDILSAGLPLPTPGLMTTLLMASRAAPIDGASSALRPATSSTSEQHLRHEQASSAASAMVRYSRTAAAGRLARHAGVGSRCLMTV